MVGNEVRKKRIRIAVALLIGVLTVYGVIQNSILIVVMAITSGIVALYISGRSVTEVVRDERTLLIRSKAASATLAIVTVGMSIAGLLLVFFGGDYEQVGFLLAYQAIIILCLNALLGYYYRNKLGG